MRHPVPGLEAHPDLLRRYENRVAALWGKAGCGGCGIGAVNAEFARLLAKRLERDKLSRRK